MPDPNKLASFLQRTQKAMQAAVDAGDQAGVDQYENFLDRGNAVGERLLGQSGPQGQQGATGLAGMVPQQQAPQAPQLMGGDQPPANPSNPMNLLAPPGQLAQDRQGETSNPFTLAGMGKPKSAIDQMINAVPKAPPSVYNGPTTSYTGAPVPTEPAAPSVASGVNPALLGGGTMGFMQPPLPAGNPLVDGIAPSLQGLGEFLDPSLKPNLGRMMLGPSGEMNATRGGASNAGIGTEQPKDPEMTLSLDTAIKNTQDKPDIQAELLKLKQQMGPKPTFFTLENLAMMLLMGAPRAYGHFKGNVHDWQNRQDKLDDIGLQYQFGKAGDKMKQDHFAAQQQLERDKAAATLAPHIVTGKQKPILDEMNDVKSEIRTLEMNPSFDPNKRDSAIAMRIAALESHYAELQTASQEAASAVYDKKKK